MVLPIKNFYTKSKRVQKLLSSAFGHSINFEPNIQKFIRDYYNRSLSPSLFQDERELIFPPDISKHGIFQIGDKDLTNLAFVLGGYYRLGVPYPDDLHFDVQRMNNKPLNAEFHCERKGPTGVLTDTKINISPNDIII